MPRTSALLVSDIVGVLLLTVNRRPLLVGVDVGHFVDDDATESAEGTSVLVDACGDVTTGPLTVVGVTSCCRV